MKKLKPIVSVFLVSLSFSIMGCSANSESNNTRAIFDTKKEAAEAAKNFNCTGAHLMGDKWMPCKSHNDHKKMEKNQKHGGHHHHQ